MQVRINLFIYNSAKKFSRFLIINICLAGSRAGIVSWALQCREQIKILRADGTWYHSHCLCQTEH